jgi:hypothetical protein
MASTELTDQILCQAVAEMEKGLIDADWGGGVVKKRVALPGRGKSGSARTLIATNKKDRWFFVWGFEKNVQENINHKELKEVQKIASFLLKLNSGQLDIHIKNGEIREICKNENKSN